MMSQRELNQMIVDSEMYNLVKVMSPPHWLPTPSSPLVNHIIVIITVQDDRSSPKPLLDPKNALVGRTVGWG